MLLEWLLFGFILGIGAAVPIGPINLEITRRNLTLGTRYGVTTGLGACTADLFYLLLLSLGLLIVLQNALFLRLVGFAGGSLLLWFAYKAFTAQASKISERKHSLRLWRHGIEGFLMTLLNPYTILFWASVSVQVVNLQYSNEQNTLLWVSTGLMLGTFGWVLLLNSILHVTRHRLSDNFILLLNRLGAIVLLGFGGFGIMRSIYF